MNAFIFFLVTCKRWKDTSLVDKILHLLTDTWRHNNNVIFIKILVYVRNYLQNVSFGSFVVWKLTELCPFVSYFWDDFRIIYVYCQDCIIYVVWTKHRHGLWQSIYFKQAFTNVFTFILITCAYKTFTDISLLLNISIGTVLKYSTWILAVILRHCKTYRHAVFVSNLRQIYVCVTVTRCLSISLILQLIVC